jgi:hypothetical protein
MLNIKVYVDVTLGYVHIFIISHKNNKHFARVSAIVDNRL